jgi:hypothetical protein
MSSALGLSIGVANLVAVRAGGVPVSRGSVLTLFARRPSEVGLPDQDPNFKDAGLVVRGFVERVGDGSPLVAGGGARYIGAALTVEALEAMARIVGYGSPIGIAVPAYWSESQIAALRSEFRNQPTLTPNGVRPLLVSDATATAAELRGKPGFPTKGVVALCDIGAGGTSVTLIRAGADLKQIGQSVRRTDFSGDSIDQLIANHLESRARDASTASLEDAVRTGGFSLRDCQRVKEFLSGVGEPVIGADFGMDLRLSRKDFDQLIALPLSRFITSVEEMLQRSNIPRDGLTAVAVVGGGASTPGLKTPLSERLRVPVITTPRPAFTAALGAAILARQQWSADSRRAPSPVVTTPPQSGGVPPTMANAPRTMAGGPPTMAATPPTRASTPRTMASMPPTLAAPPPARAGVPPAVAGGPQTETAVTASTGERGDGGSAPHGALAWSEAPVTGEEPVLYTGAQHTDEGVAETTADDDEDRDEERDQPAKPGKLPWYKHTVLILMVAGACAAVLAAGGLTISLLGRSKTSPPSTTTPSQSQTSQTTTTTATTPSTTTTEVPTPIPAPPATTTDYAPPPTRSYPPRSNPPLTTTPSQKSTKSPSPSTTPSTTKNHGPLLPPFLPPTTKH